MGTPLFGCERKKFFDRILLLFKTKDMFGENKNKIVVTEKEIYDTITNVMRQ